MVAQHLTQMVAPGGRWFRFSVPVYYFRPFGFWYVGIPIGRELPHALCTSNVAAVCTATDDKWHAPEFNSV